MTVGELLEKLKTCPPEARVYFDTEAQCYDVHLVPVDLIYTLDGDCTPNGQVVVTLHEAHPHRSGHSG